jgi:hypothetical protein
MKSTERILRLKYYGNFFDMEIFMQLMIVLISKCCKHHEIEGIQSLGAALRVRGHLTVIDKDRKNRKWHSPRCFFSSLLLLHTLGLSGRLNWLSCRPYRRSCSWWTTTKKKPSALPTPWPKVSHRKCTPHSPTRIAPIS